MQPSRIRRPLPRGKVMQIEATTDADALRAAADYIEDLLGHADEVVLLGINFHFKEDLDEPNRVIAIVTLEVTE